MATKYNFFIDCGADFELTIDVDNETNIDLSDFTIEAKLLKHYLAYSNTAIPFICSINAESQTVTLNMTHNTTSSIEPGRYVYDVKLTSSSNVVLRLIEGMVTVNPQATRT